MKTTKKEMREAMVRLFAKGRPGLGEKERTECLSQIYPARKARYADHCVCSECGHIIPDPDAAVCPKCGSGLRGEINTRSMTYGMCLDTRFAAKYSRVRDRVSGLSFRVESVYACYMETHVDSATGCMTCSRWAALCYQNWYTEADGKTYRGVMSARIKMNPSYTYCPFSVGPWSGNADYRPRTPNMSRTYWSYNDWWSFDADHVVGRRFADGDPYNSWKAQAKSESERRALWF